MGLMLRKGEKIDLKGRRISVTDIAFECLPRVRDHLLIVAKSGGTTTYGELKADLSLRYTVNGMGRLLDLLSVDCGRRGEPSLAAIVVGSTTGEVGHDFAGDPVAERADLYEHWA